MCVGVGVNLANCRVQGVRCKGYGLVLRYCRAGKHTAKCAHHEGCGRCCTSRGLWEVLCGWCLRAVGGVVLLVFVYAQRCLVRWECCMCMCMCGMGVYVYVYVWDGGVCG